jgi:hypothetical protein
MERSQNFESSASAPSVVRMLVSEQFAEDLAAELGVDLISVEAHENDGVWTHAMSCEFNTERMSVPGVVRKVLPGHLRVDWESTWTVESDTRATAALNIRTATSPAAQTVGDADIATDGAEVTYTFNGKTSVSVPFVGGTLAGLIDDKLIRRVIDDQTKVLARALA